MKLLDPWTLERLRSLDYNIMPPREQNDIGVYGYFEGNEFVPVSKIDPDNNITTVTTTDVVTCHYDFADPITKWSGELKTNMNNKEKEKKEVKDYCYDKVPHIEKVVFNDPATIVMWTDHTKTVVKVREGETFDKWTGLSMAICKKLYGDKFHSTFTKYCGHTEEEKLTPDTILEASFSVDKEHLEEMFSPFPGFRDLFKNIFAKGEEDGDDNS